MLAALWGDAEAGTLAQWDHLQVSGQRMQKGRMTERALQLFDGMRQQGLLSEVITYSALISAWEKCRMTKRALHSLVGFGNSRGLPSKALLCHARGMQRNVLMQT